MELGVMYMLGRGVQKDDVMAVHWWRKAADQGYAFSLGDRGIDFIMGLDEVRNQKMGCSMLGIAANNTDYAVYRMNYNSFCVKP